MNKSGYYSGYKNPEPIKKQAEILGKYFSKRIFPEIESQDLPVYPGLGSEGWFVIPDLQKKDYVNLIYNLIIFFKKNRKENVSCNLGPWMQCLCQTKETQEGLEKQKKIKNLVCFPAQFGIRHKDTSVNEIKKSLKPNEIALGFCEIIFMLITHPHRFQAAQDLDILCMGDEIVYKGCRCTLGIRHLGHSISIELVYLDEKMIGYGCPTFFKDIV